MILLLLFGLLPLVFCGEPPEFTDDDFKVKVGEKDYTFVMFYAPWCGHCKQLKPAFESARKVLVAEKNDVELARVDCTKHTKICGEFGVSGYPTLKFFVKGKFTHDFNGDRDEAGIINYVSSRSRPPSTELESKSSVERFTEEGEALRTLVVVAHLTEKQLPKVKDAALSMLGEVIFAHTFKSGVIDLDEGWMRVYRPKALATKLEDRTIETKISDMSKDDVSKWIYKNGQGLVGYRTPKNEKFFPQRNLLVLYNNASLDNYPKGVNYFRNRLIKLIRTNPVGDDFVYAYSYTADYYQELSDLEMVRGSEVPFMVIYSGGKKYLGGTYSPDVYVEFVNKFRAGSLEPYIKSEPIPGIQHDACLHVVGNTFDSIVNDPTKDVFIMFHAPWCGHCKKLMPKFKEAAETLKDETSVVFVHYDATANEVFEPYKVRGYPTLYFVKKGAKRTPERYEGGREIDDLIKHVAAASTDGLRGYDREGNEIKSEL